MKRFQVFDAYAYPLFIISAYNYTDAINKAKLRGVHAPMVEEIGSWS